MGRQEIRDSGKESAPAAAKINRTTDTNCTYATDCAQRNEYAECSTQSRGG